VLRGESVSLAAVTYRPRQKPNIEYESREDQSLFERFSALPRFEPLWDCRLASSRR
jgi:hypothetical protein